MKLNKNKISFLVFLSTLGDRALVISLYLTSNWRGRSNLVRLLLKMIEFQLNFTILLFSLHILYYMTINLKIFSNLFSQLLFKERVKDVEYYLYL